jgi:RND superfamily putative drug exporter
MESIAIPLSFVVLVWVFGGLLTAALPLAVGCLSILGSMAVLRAITVVTDVSIFALNLLIAFSPVSSVLDGSLLVKRQPPDVTPPRVQAGDEGNIRGLISALGRRAVGDDANIGDGHEHMDVT